MKERVILYANRPWAISPAEDIGLERYGCLVDESIAIQLNLPVRNLQYVPLSLVPNDKKKARVTGTVRITVQNVVQGRPGNSLALNARIIRGLFDMTGFEATCDKLFSKKLADISSKKKEVGIPLPSPSPTELRLATRCKWRSSSTTMWTPLTMSKATAAMSVAVPSARITAAPAIAASVDSAQMTQKTRRAMSARTRVHTSTECHVTSMGPAKLAS